MSYVVLNLADGQLPDTKTTLYTATTTTIVKSIIYTVSTNDTVTVNLYFKKSGGTSRSIIPPDLSLEPFYIMEGIDTALTMGVGDEIEGSCVVVDVVDYIISGTETP